VLFIIQGIVRALTQGVDSRINRTNVATGLLSIAAGILIIAWPTPGIVAVAIILGAWLIVSGGITIAASFAARDVLPDWWLVLILGLLEVPLGVLALANPGATLAALITVAGIWGVAVGITQIVLAFNIKNLPKQVDKAWATPATATSGNGSQSTPPRVASGNA
jgi:uncharacterized membrane protein HdeD (DUF308 family)